MKRAVWSDLSPAEQRQLLARPAGRSDPALKARVAEIVAQVRDGGWNALCELATAMDGAPPRPVPIAAAAAEARRRLSADEQAAFDLAVANITAFHAASRPADLAVETMPGLTVRKVWRPIDRVGLYVPGGATPLFSTLLMLALPARAAGVGELAVTTPPRADGSLDPLVALAAERCGIDAVWTVGGAQAIAALAFGAGEIGRCDKIGGPGNAWVAEAKTQVAALPGGPAIDMPAGPSELMVIADERADPAAVAADLLSQAEHDPQAQVLLATASAALLASVEQELARQVATLPRRAIAERALDAARLIRCADLAEATAVANAYAPEHLALNVADPAALVPLIRHAGSIFAGRGAAEAFGDYCAGSSHVLPTDGAARAWGGVSVLTFMKAMTVQELTPAAAAAIAPAAAALARLEGLEAHARSAEARLAEACA
ncbi:MULTISPECIES: histidinol dehydrogenase [Sphingomonas]|uniref:histidinol dehydrogenase n=1 Tax=Sphingomonas TaxID=13687 RepID=UPI000DEFDB4D|nr:MULTISPECIES: histidinol dehydrogenase [Sphingomonas]